MSRLLFRGVNAIIAVATLALGSLQLALGTRNPIYGAADLPSLAVLDSNLRFFGGMAVGLALLLLWALPSIERHSDVVLVFWGCAFLGGVGRLVSAALIGAPPMPMLVFTVIEVVGAPAMIVWSSQLRSSPAS